MIVNFKKTLLVGTALVATSFALPTTAHAVVEVLNDGTSYIDGASITAGSGNILAVMATGKVYVEGDVTFTGSSHLSANVDALTVTLANKSDAAVLTLPSMSENGKGGLSVTLANEATGAFDFTTNSGDIILGAGTLTVNGASATQKTILNASGVVTADAININDHGVLKLNNTVAQAVNGAINSAAAAGTVEILNNSDAGVTFNNAVKLATLTMGATGKKATFKANTEVTNAVTLATGQTLAFDGAITATFTGGVTGTGNLELANGVSSASAYTVTNITSSAGDNALSGVVVTNAGGTVSVTAGKLTFTGNDSTFNGAMSAATSSAIELNQNGTANVNGNVSGAGKLSVGAGRVDMTGGTINIATVEFSGNGVINANKTGTVFQSNVNFNGKNATVNLNAGTYNQNFTTSGTAYTGSLEFGAGKTVINGALGAANMQLNGLTFNDTTEINSAVHARTVFMRGDVTAKHATFDSNVLFSKDVTLTFDNAVTVSGDITREVEGTGAVIFKAAGSRVVGEVTRLRAFTINGDASVGGTFHAADTTNIGTHKLTVTGAVTTSADSTLNFTVDTPTHAGSIVSSAAANIHQGTKVNITVADNVYIDNNTKFTLVDGAASTNGVNVLTQDNIKTLNSAVVQFVQDTSNKEDLVVTVNRQALNASNLGGNASSSPEARNRGAIGAMFDALRFNGDANMDGVQNRIASEKTWSGVARILDSLIQGQSGATTQVLSTNNNRASNIISMRQGQVRAGVTGKSSGDIMDGSHLWVQGFGSMAEQGEREGMPGYDADSYGSVIGFDKDFGDNTNLGLALTYSRSDVNGSDVNTTSMDIDSYQIALYGDHDLGQGYFVSGQASYTHSNIDQVRHNVGLIAGNNAHADYDSNQYGARLEAGRTWLSDDVMSFTPSILANYAHIDFDDYSETGANSLRLKNVDSNSVDVFELGFNLNAEGVVNTSAGKLFPSVNAGYRYDLIGDSVSTTASIVGGGTAFKTQSAEPARGSVNLGAGLRWETSSNWEFNAQYDYERKDDYNAHSALVRAGYRF